MKLNVSEVFYSIQGEGITAGTPAVFLRLGGCNLLCEWCDSIEVWKHSVATDFNDILPLNYLYQLQKGAHLVITGGEPLLHSNKIVKFLIWLNRKINYMPIIEIETNGTIIPQDDLIPFVKYWNVSPKLSNSKEPLEKRINTSAIVKIQDTGSATFKFVVNSGEDINEILTDYAFIQRKNIVLMPLASDTTELQINRTNVIKWCMNMGYRYSDRLQVAVWNKTTGV